MMMNRRMEWNGVDVENPNIKMSYKFKCFLIRTVDSERNTMSTFPLISCVYLQPETLF